ncbi:MAG: hypothetical protein GX437_05375 [Sphingobacteriales bacterium]|nr:hypothetical protein [Sphingobacteriales bacterium]
MKKLISLSKSINILVIVCFFLPFVILDCEDKSGEKQNAENEQVKPKVAVTFDTSDIVSPDSNASISTGENVIQPDSSGSKQGKREKFINKISLPDGKAYSVLGIFIQLWPILIFGIVAFIFVFIFYLQFFRQRPVHILILLILAFILLCIGFFKYKPDLLRYGFYLTWAFNLLMLILEIIILRKMSAEKN